MTTTNEEALTTLRRQAEGRQQAYMQTLGEIKALKTQLTEAMAQLADQGCTTLTEADDLAATLQAQIDDQLAEIRRLLE